MNLHMPSLQFGRNFHFNVILNNPNNSEWNCELQSYQTRRYYDSIFLWLKTIQNYPSPCLNVTGLDCTQFFLKGKASVPTDDLIPKTRRCRNQHSMAFQTPIANTDVYKGSLFPQTIRDWNALPDSLISSAEDAEDCVAKFTSLVRARD